ncbi:MAG: NADH-quinone oxidoreductase subunit A [Zavarzinella sp.]
MTDLVIILLVFIAIGVGFLFINMLLGKLLRPAKPNQEKGDIYECGEPTIGESWIQFDLRFYVVALLFIIFDVEVVFFFPWAAVFGSTNQLAEQNTPPEVRQEIHQRMNGSQAPPSVGEIGPATAAAKTASRIAFLDLAVFFSILLVGFAYLWKVGDLEWVKATTGTSVEHHTTLPSTVEAT